MSDAVVAAAPWPRASRTCTLTRTSASLACQAFQVPRRSRRQDSHAPSDMREIRLSVDAAQAHVVYRLQLDPSSAVSPIARSGPNAGTMLPACSRRTHAQTTSCSTTMPAPPPALNLRSKMPIVVTECTGYVNELHLNSWPTGPRGLRAAMLASVSCALQKRNAHIIAISAQRVLSLAHRGIAAAAP